MGVLMRTPGAAQRLAEAMHVQPSDDAAQVVAAATQLVQVEIASAPAVATEKAAARTPS